MASLLKELLDSTLEMFLGIFCERRLALGLLIENYLIMEFLEGKKSFGNFW